MASNLSILVPYGMEAVEQSAEFYTPADIPVSEVLEGFEGEKRRRQLGNIKEAMGYTVLWISQPRIRKSRVTDDPDRRYYELLVVAARRPVLHTMDVPDSAVPGMLGLGWQLKE